MVGSNSQYHQDLHLCYIEYYQRFRCLRVRSSHFKLWFTLFLSAPPHPKRLPQKDRPILLDDTGRAIYGHQSTNRPTLYSHQPEYILFFPPYPISSFDQEHQIVCHLFLRLSQAGGSRGPVSAGEAVTGCCNHLQVKINMRAGFACCGDGSKYNKSQ